MPNTEHFEWPYPELSDEADVPADMKAALDAIEGDVKDLDVSNLKAAEADKGKLLIVQGTGDPAWKEAIGDVTASTAGALTIGDGKVTSRKMAPTVGVLRATETKTLEGIYQDIPGLSLEITPDVDSLLLVTSVYCFQVRGAAGSKTAYGSLYAANLEEGTQREAGEADFNMTNAEEITLMQGTFAQVFQLELSEGKKYLVRQQAKAEAEEALIVKEKSKMLYQLVAAA